MTTPHGDAHPGNPLACLKVQVSAAIPAGEVRLASGCSWTRTRPGGDHGEPEWRVAAMCEHEHLRVVLLCSACKEELVNWRLRGPVFCDACHGHQCPLPALEVRRL